jgi:pimeloyl-ACP methyl ester carboxylesterase
VLSKDLSESARARAIRKTISILGIETVYFEYPAASESAEALIMIHGYRGNHHGLEAIAAGLGDYRVLIPDLPGFGESEPLPKTHTISSYVEWLKEFVDAVQVGAPNLMGHSFGTLVVAHYATKHLLRSLILVNPVSAPALAGPRATLTRITRSYYRIARSLPNALGERFLRARTAVMVMSVAMAKTKNPELRRWIHLQHLNNFSDFASVAVAVEGYQASISTHIAALAAEISAPTLLIAAELDDITSLDQQRKVAASNPNITIREIAGVGHLVHYEAPDQAARLITEFLRELN